jgi:hypothetical protein
MFSCRFVGMRSGNVSAERSKDRKVGSSGNEKACCSMSFIAFLQPLNPTKDRESKNSLQHAEKCTFLIIFQVTVCFS